MENDKAIEQLLTQVASINKHYEEIAKISGENFNIFNILDLTSKELIHSKFIAMLLNPKGEHQMGSVFLNLFIKTINIEKCNEIDFSNAIIKQEDPVPDGRMDISITAMNGKKIIIENKVYAKDQDGQLSCYYESGTESVLLYLTLDGHNPKDTSKRGLEKDQDYYCISYKMHILNWLELCVKETKEIPFLRETLNQYILLIKQLTGQARRDKMNNEVLDLITRTEENLSAYLILEKLKKETVLKYIQEKIFRTLNEIAKNSDLVLEDTDYNSQGILTYEYGFKFYKESWKDKISIWFSFAENLTNMEYGIYDEEKGHIGEGKKPMEKYWHLKNTEVLAKLCSQNDDFVQEIETKIKELIPKVEALLK